MSSPPASGPIWSKRTSGGPSAAVLAYCSGRDVKGRPAADEQLIPYDLWTNRAHCLMLQRRRIIDAGTCRLILEELERIEEAWHAGRLRLDPALEDVHMNLERLVARRDEAAAGVMHTARSRNDQSATDVRLWLRDRLLEQTLATAELVQTLGRLARAHAETIAPGWTHGQPAMPTTLGHWAAAHGFALTRDLAALRALWPLINVSPLGAAASFGTSWPIDRRLSARLLAFDAPQANSLDAISTRWEAEARLGGVLAILMSHLASLGQDLIFLSTPPRVGLRLADAHVSGSSIMPNKRNPDFAEVTRARALAVQGLAANLAGVGRGLLTGYNRDTQWTKYWVMDLVEEVGEAPRVFAEVLGGLRADRPVLRELATAGFALAADLADHLARTRHLPFRQAYHVVAEAVARDEARGWISAATLNEILRRAGIDPPLTPEELDAAGRPEQALARRGSLGGPEPGDVRGQAAALGHLAGEARQWARAQARRIAAARDRVRRTRPRD